MALAAAPSRPLTNAEIAQRLVVYAAVLQEKGENPFKVRAYRRGAQLVKALRESVDGLVRSGADLTRYPGIGKGIAAALGEIVSSGTIGQLELPLAAAPPEVAAVSGRIPFDPTRILLDDADLLAVQLERFLLGRCGATRVECAGDVRRRVETVGEVVFVVETADFAALVRRFARFRGGVDLIETAQREATFQLPGSIMIALHGATEANWGTALVLATGSRGHLDELEPVGALARRAKTEVEAYTSVGLAWVPPELREGRGEVALAAAGKLPRLVELADIRGDLHMHTVASDGVDSIEAMADAAKARGYEYVGITDHSQSLKIARGVSIANLRTQIRRIDKLNARLSGIRILKSAEVDILGDGSLDYPDDLLAELDYTICSIHSRFRMSRAEQTERVLRAMDHPAFTILGHATGRLLLKRTGYELDMPRIIAHAKARGCSFEINADPDRLDLSSDHVREAAGAGIKLAIGTDAHRVAGLDYMRCGLDVARRAGLKKSDVLNTASLAPLLGRLRR